MLNPDGVFLGNYRSTLMGFDLNRSWHIASPWAHPALRATIDMLLALDKNKVKKIINYNFCLIYKLQRELLCLINFFRNFN